MKRAEFRRYRRLQGYRRLEGVPAVTAAWTLPGFAELKRLMDALATQGKIVEVRWERGDTGRLDFDVWQDGVNIGGGYGVEVELMAAELGHYLDAVP